MKKYLFGMSAILLAIAFSAFTTKTTDQYVYQYDGTSYTVPATVQNKANWDLVGLNQGACSGDQVKACRIALDKDFVDFYFPGGAPNVLTEFDGQDDADDAPELSMVVEDDVEDGIYRLTEVEIESELQDFSNRPL